MITNDIQELFDGSLSDEASAELLHALSVSPERRAEFRQVMTLQGAMRKDRFESALTQEVDESAWRGITAAVGIGAVATAPRVGTLAWSGRGVAMVIVGVGGYLLGLAPSDPAVVRPESPDVVVSLAAGSERLGSDLVGFLPRGGPNRSAQPAAVPVTDRIVYRDRIVDRIVYRDRAPSSHLMADEGGSRSTRRSPVDGFATSAPTTMSAPPLGPLPDTSGNAPILSIEPTETPSVITPSAMTTRNTIAAMKDPFDLPPTARRVGRDDLNYDDIDLPIAALRRSGIEVAYNERVGRLAALPQGETESPDYSARYLDLSYRFDMGSYGLGLRFGQGTFSSVSLVGDQTIRRDGAVARIDTIYRPRIGETRETTVEFFANYRFPIARRFALGLEMAYNLSTTHQKLGGDLFALWFLTERVGVQLGGGLSHYWYDLSGERRRLLEGGENVGVSDDALDSYRGSVLEGRYGIFYRF